MNRQEKEKAIADLQDSFRRASVALVTTGQGLDVPTVQALRRSLRKAGGEFKVAKNTLAKLAIRETDFQALDSTFQGPTGIVFGYADPVSVAKILVKFSEDHQELSVAGGVLGRQFLAETEVKSLASLPSREVVLAQLLGLLQAPATQLLRTLNEPGAQLARLVESLRARLDQQ